MPTPPRQQQMPGDDSSWAAVFERLRSVTSDEYDVLTILGRGGMAAVFLAHEQRLQRRVALKVMSPALMLGHNMIERFHQEAITQANLSHPGIVSVYAVRERMGLHYFAMQYVPGRSLQEALRGERTDGRELEIAAVRALLFEVGSALEYAHGFGVIHRDVKPGNVLLNADGRPVVTDFGIAKVLSAPSLTLTNTAHGTPAYMSPEQCMAAEPTPASDQYSLGIVAYELLTGAPPFAGDSFTVMQAHTIQQPPPLRARRPDCPPEVEQAVGRMLAKHASDRFPSIGAALEALGAQPLSPRSDDAVRRELVRLADVPGVNSRFSDEVRAAMTTPRSAERVRSRAPSPTWNVTRGATAPAAPYSPGAGPHTPDSGSRGAVVARIDVARPESILAIGERVTLAATARDAAGRELRAAVRWTTTTPEIIEVDEDGGVVALQWGRGEVVVQTGQATETVPVVVGVVPLASVELLDVPPRVRRGTRVRLRARALDALGRERAIPIRCESSDQRVASVEDPLVLVATSPGRASITARLGTVSKRYDLVVDDA